MNSGAPGQNIQVGPSPFLPFKEGLKGLPPEIFMLAYGMCTYSDFQMYRGLNRSLKKLSGTNSGTSGLCPHLPSLLLHHWLHRISAACPHGTSVKLSWRGLLPVTLNYVGKYISFFCCQLFALLMLLDKQCQQRVIFTSPGGSLPCQAIRYPRHCKWLVLSLALVLTTLTLCFTTCHEKALISSSTSRTVQHRSRVALVDGSKVHGSYVAA